MSPSTVDSLLQRGISHFQANEVKEAAVCFEEAVRASPVHAEAHHLLGVVIHRLGDRDKAIPLLKRSIELEGTNGTALRNLSVMLTEEGNHDEALRFIRLAVRQQPDHAANHYQLGFLLRNKGENDAALQSFARALELDPLYPEAHLLRGNCLRDLDRCDEAEEAYRKELELFPHRDAARFNWGLLCISQKNNDKAVSVLTEVTPSSPHYARAMSSIAEIYRNEKQFEMALTYHLRAIESPSKGASDLVGYAATLKQMDRLDQIPSILEEVEANYGTDSESLSNAGILYFYLDRFDDAIRLLDKAVSQGNAKPLVRTNAGILFLTQKNYRKGWELFASRSEMDTVALSKLPLDKGKRWRGESLDGKTVIVVEEQGLGDSIQFIRFAALLKERYDCEVCFFSKPRLSACLRGCAGVDRWLSRVDSKVEYDLWCPLLDLPGYLGCFDESQFPAPDSYLTPVGQRWEFWREKLGERKPGEWRVGICWQGNKEYKGDHTRSFPVAAAKELFSLPNTRFYSLQKGYGEEQLDALPDCRILRLGDSIDNDGFAFLDSAAVLSHLDLLVGCDSSLCHLAGALGVPVWLALGQEPDWRWGRSGTKTVWYPNTTLFRRSRVESWESLFQRMVQDWPMNIRSLKERRTVPLADSESYESMMSRANEANRAGALELSEHLLIQILSRFPRDTRATLSLTILFLQWGRKTDAERILEAALESEPENPQLHFYMAQTLRLLTRNEQAIEWMENSLRMEPRFPLGWSELSKLYGSLGRADDALHALERGAESNPEHAPSQAALGEVYRSRQRIADASAKFEIASRLDPKNASHLGDWGVCVAQLGDVESGIAKLRRAIELNPNFAAGLANLSALLFQVEEIEEAKSNAERAVEIEPTQATALTVLAMFYRRKDLFDKAAEYCRRAYQSAPDRSEIRLLYAWAMQTLSDDDEQDRVTQIIEQRDRGSGDALNYLGNYYRNRKQLERAREFYEKSIQTSAQAVRIRNQIEAVLSESGSADRVPPVFPDEQANASTLSPLVNLGLLALAQQDYRRAWIYYGLRDKQLPSVPQNHLPKSRWDGGPLDGKSLLVLNEQGMGDVLQFSRFFRDLKKKHRCRIVFFCPKRMIPFLRQIKEVDEWIDQLPSTAAVDCWAYLMSLPQLLGLYTADEMEIESPYLVADPKKVESWRDRIRAVPGFRVGLAWRGNPTYVLDRQRRIPERTLSRLSSVEGCSFVCLQKEPGKPTVDGLPLIDWSGEIDVDAAFVDTAAIIQNLDLVITVDTSIAHVAGALGKEVWIALPFVPDWRWGLEGERSFWYPTARLYRQSIRGDWDRVLDQIVQDLRSTCQRSQHSPPEAAVEFSKPKVSVVIPAFNAASTIEQTIRSVMRQSVPSEIIVVDDGSTDGTVDRVQPLVGSGAVDLYLIRQTNRGPAAARNTGLRLARGRYICFLDSDDEFADGFLESTVRALDNNPQLVGVYTDIEVVDAHREIQPWQLGTIAASIPSNLLVRTIVAKEIEGFPTSPAFRGKAAGEDIAFRRQLLFYGKVGRLTKTLFRYRAQRGSHLDYFLDRAVPRPDGSIECLKYSKEELDGSITLANASFDQSTRRKILTQQVQKLAAACQTAQEIKDFLAAHGSTSHDSMAALWLARFWPCEGTTVLVSDREDSDIRIGLSDGCRLSTAHRPFVLHTARELPDADMKKIRLLWVESENLIVNPWSWIEKLELGAAVVIAIENRPQPTHDWTKWFDFERFALWTRK